MQILHVTEKNNFILFFMLTFLLSESTRIYCSLKLSRTCQKELKMYSVRTVTFSILFCCHFIYSWQDSETLLERYYNYLRMLSEDELLKMKTE